MKTPRRVSDKMILSYVTAAKKNLSLVGVPSLLICIEQLIEQKQELREKLRQSRCRIRALLWKPRNSKHRSRP